MTALLVLTALIGVAHPHEGVHERVEAVEARVAAQPDRAVHRVALADAYRRAGRPDLALAELEEAARLDPSDKALWLVKAEAHRDLGELAEAEGAADRLLASGPDFAGYALRADVRALRGRPLDALDDWDAAIALRVTPDAVIARGRLAEDIGDLDRAAAGYRQGSGVAVRQALIEVELRRDRPDAAIAEADALLAANPDHPDWLLLRAHAHEVAGDAASARLDRERALAVLDAQLAVRDTALRRLARARALLALVQVDDARSELEGVVARAPRLPDAQDLLITLEDGR